MHNINVGSQDVLVTPEQLKRALPMTGQVRDMVAESRQVIRIFSIAGTTGCLWWLALPIHDPPRPWTTRAA